MISVEKFIENAPFFGALFGAFFVAFCKNLFMPLFLTGCFPGYYRKGKRPNQGGKRPMNTNGQFLGSEKCFGAVRAIFWLWDA